MVLKEFHANVKEPKYVVIVEMNQWHCTISWQPKVLPLSRDRPKTIFTKTRFGERRWSKDKIRYKIFERQVDALRAIPTSVNMAIKHMDHLRSEWENQRGRAQTAVIDMVHDWHGRRINRR